MYNLCEVPQTIVFDYDDGFVLPRCDIVATSK